VQPKLCAGREREVFWWIMPTGEGSSVTLLLMGGKSTPWGINHAKGKLATKESPSTRKTKNTNSRLRGRKVRGHRFRKDGEEGLNPTRILEQSGKGGGYGLLQPSGGAVADKQKEERIQVGSRSAKPETDGRSRLKIRQRTRSKRPIKNGTNQVYKRSTP